MAFTPVNFSEQAMTDEWSGGYGCGVKYFSKDSVIKLAHKAGIALDDSLSLAEKLKEVQKLLEKEHEGAVQIFRTIGIYLGYAVAQYVQF